jgi:heterodisulfide reductase subunit A-like polyferredoxin
MTNNKVKSNGNERIGVYICHCGTNIAGVVDVEGVAKWATEALRDDGVVLGKDYKFMCSSLGQEMIQEDIKKEGLTRVVVLPTFARENLPRCNTARWIESLSMRDGFHP